MRPITRAALGEHEFLGWLGQATAGEVLPYHRGFLAIDRNWSVERQLDRLAALALWAAENGFVHLVQRRHGPEDASYIAIARKHPTSLSDLIEQRP
jgi:hypothetical protein